MRKTLLFLILLFILIVIISTCEYFTLMSQKEWLEKSGQEDDVIIYVGGWYTSGDTIPCYWKIKNDKIERVDLGYISNDLNNKASSIYVVGDNVYTCGESADAGGTRRACYWINEKRCYLETSGTSRAESIKVFGGIVFTTGDDNGNACYWVNQEKYTLNIQTANTIFIQQISSSKYETYIGGSMSGNYACYWKDGVTVGLPASTTPAGIYSIYVLGNTIYSAGYSPSGAQRASYWKNDKLTILDNTVTGIAYSIFVSNDNVYIAARVSPGDACYWKNDKLYMLTSTNTGFAESIYVFNDIVYVAGRDAGFACYWVNGKQKFLDTLNNSYAYSIFIKLDNKN